MNIDEIKARAKDAKNDVDGHDAENMTYHYYHDVTALIAEVERLQQQLNAAVEDCKRYSRALKRHGIVIFQDEVRGERSDKRAQISEKKRLMIICRE